MITAALVFAAVVAGEHPVPLTYIPKPASQIHPRSFMCSHSSDGFGYLVFARNKEQNFVDFWEKQSGDTPKENLLSLSIKDATQFASSGFGDTQLFQITAEDSSKNTIRFEFRIDQEHGLKGVYNATVDNKVSRGECTQIAMLPGYEASK
jgi:hypothetical protein